MCLLMLPLAGSHPEDKINLAKNKMSTSNQANLKVLIDKYATRFFASLITIICLIMFVFGPQIIPSYKDVFISVSTSLLASLIFALIYSSVVERHHMIVVNEELSLSVKEAVAEIKQLQQDNMQIYCEQTFDSESPQPYLQNFVNRPSQ